MPGKVLMDIAGQTTLAHVIHRLLRCNFINEVVVATTTDPADDAIVEECLRRPVGVFRGSQEDVLERYYQAAQAAGAETLVRITSDNPLIDPGVTGQAIKEFLELQPDYASNAILHHYPAGLDTEVMTFEALERCYWAAAKPYQRAHVTPYIYENPDLFKIHAVRGEGNYRHYRWTLDTPEDLEFIRSVYSAFEGRDDFSWRDVLGLLERRPELAELNRNIQAKALEEG